jgi:hypothetical protein
MPPCDFSQRLHSCKKERSQGNSGASFRSVHPDFGLSNNSKKTRDLKGSI